MAQLQGRGGAEGLGCGPGGRLAVAADSSHLITIPLISVGHQDLGERGVWSSAAVSGTETTSSDWKAALYRNCTVNKTNTTSRHRSVCLRCREWVYKACCIKYFESSGRVEKCYIGISPLTRSVQGGA